MIALPALLPPPLPPPPLPRNWPSTAAHLLGSAPRGFGAGAGDCSKCRGRGSHPVKVVEGGPKFIHLLLADALGISGQDLILHFVDGPGDGGEELLPAHTDVLGMVVIEEPVSQGPQAWA